MKRLPLLTALFALALCIAVFAQNAYIGSNVQIHPVSDSYHYPVGETLHYSADWRIWRAGQAVVKLEPNGNEMHITGTADSSGVVAVLYRVYDRYDSYFDRLTFCSSRIVKHSEEGLHKRETTVRYDAARGRAVLDERNLRNNQTKHEEHEIPPCVTDALSGIYYLRTLPLAPGNTYEFPANDGGKTVIVKAVVEAREEVKTEAGTFHTVRVQPSSESGLLKQRGKVWIWYTDDPQHIPVQMRTRMFWGTLTVQLTRIDRQ
ncbi:MAG TPA: DUF3108 domain-containing protein [Terriglobales bacterium]